MNVTRKNNSETEVLLTITVDEKALQAVKQKTLAKLAKTIKAPGFRPGKAPLAVAEKQIDANQLQAEILQDALEAAYPDAVTKEELRPLGNPEIEIRKYTPYTELEFTAKIGVMPIIKLADYTKIKKQISVITVPAKEVDDVITNLRTRVATKKDVTRTASKGDEVVVDFTGENTKGEAVAGASGTDYALTLGSKTFIPGFEEGLVGLRAGDKKELELAFPKDYHAKNLAGTKITFKVEVKKVQESVLPKADDAFATTVGPFKTLADLKKDIKAQLTEQKTSEAEAKIKDEIVEEIVKNSTVPLPEVLITDQVAMLEHDFQQNLTYRGITLAEYLKQEGYENEGSWREKELLPQAQRRVGVGLVLAEIAEKEKLQVSQEELESRISLYKQQYQQSAGEFEQPEMRREVVSRLLTEKTVDRLLQIATN